MYLNIFRHRKRADIDMDAYLADAARMEELARVQPGFLDYRRFASPEGEALSISEWASEADARAWSEHPEHRAVQARARTRYYESYTVYSCADPDVRRFG